MKRQLTFLSFLAFGIFVSAQSTTVNLSLQPDYSDEVFFDFSANTFQSFPVSNWDLAFLRNGQFSFATRINTGVGIEVYEASNDPADWATIDVANIGNWTRLFNSDTTWTVGAFDKGTATYGWGEYNPTNHHVEGKVVFVLKYADGSFKKFMIEDFYGGYTFKYADWNATTSTWGADENYVLPNSTNPNNLFNYFSLVTDSEVIAAPEVDDWDIVFKKYATDLGGTMYPVTGVLHKPGTTVAENIEPGGNGNTSNLQYFDDINVIGYDWKTYSGSGYTLDPDLYFYLKQEDGTIYRLHFLSFDGSATGNVSFEYEDVTAQMGTVAFNAENSFSVFPNPSTDGQVQILYETNTGSGTPGRVAVFSLTGKKVFETQLENNGFYNQTLDLSNLSSGVYLLRFQAGKFLGTKKVVLK